MPKRHLLLRLLPCRAVNTSLTLLFIGSTVRAQQVYPVGAKVNWIRTWDAVGPDISEESFNDFFDLQIVDVISHEGQHGLQNTSDYEFSEKDTKTGQYERKGVKPYMQRSHEKNAMYKARQIYNSLVEKLNKTKKYGLNQREDD
jgi:hypothetical protein